MRLGESDEATHRFPRGCLIGPLVVAGVAVPESEVQRLKEMGVRDSKTLSPKKRESLYEEILGLSSRTFSVQIQPGVIDAVVTTGRKYRKLNYLEAIHFAKVIDGLGAGRVTVDASDSSPSRFREVITGSLRRRCSVVATHKADRDFPVVSAASIVAKVERDRAVQKLRRRLGDFGSGYPSDPVTRSFFTEMMRRAEPLPAQVRRSWKTWDRFRQTVLG